MDYNLKRAFGQFDFEKAKENLFIKPAPGRMFIKELEVRSVGSILVPQGSQEYRSTLGVVISVGPDVTLYKTGDVVFYARFSGMLFEGIFDEQYICQNADDIVGYATKSLEEIMKEYGSAETMPKQRRSC